MTTTSTIDACDLDRLAALAESRQGEQVSEALWLGAGLEQFSVAYATKHLSWCGGFALDCCHRVKLLLDRRWVTGRGFLEYPTPLPRVRPENVRRGHLVYFRKHQHHAIVADREGDSLLLVNGNGLGARVTLSHVSLDRPDAFYCPGVMS